LFLHSGRRDWKGGSNRLLHVSPAALAFFEVAEIRVAIGGVCHAAILLA
jgi:hypothetical protein